MGWAIMRVNGDSMQPTLHDGDYVIFCPKSKLLNKHKLTFGLGDIVAFRHRNTDNMIKRVLTLLPADHFEMRGDNPLSISPAEIGQISIEDIVGKAVLRITPRGIARI